MSDKNIRFPDHHNEEDFDEQQERARGAAEELRDTQKEEGKKPFKTIGSFRKWLEEEILLLSPWEKRRQEREREL